MYVVINVELFVVILRLRLFVEILLELRYSSIKIYMTSLSIVLFKNIVRITCNALSNTRDLQLKVKHRFG